MPAGADALQGGREILSKCDLVRVNDRVLNAAGILQPNELRSLDAIHLATAQLIGTRPDRVGDVRRSDGRRSPDAGTSRRVTRPLAACRYRAADAMPVECDGRGGRVALAACSDATTRHHRSGGRHRRPRRRPLDDGTDDNRRRRRGRTRTVGGAHDRRHADRMDRGAQRERRTGRRERPTDQRLQRPRCRAHRRRGARRHQGQVAGVLDRPTSWPASSRHSASHPTRPRRPQRSRRSAMTRSRRVMRRRFGRSFEEASVTTDPAFNGGEGAWVHAGVLFFTTKGDNRVWGLTLATWCDEDPSRPSETPGAPLTGVDNVTAHQATGDLFVCEDGGNMEICVIGRVNGVDTVAPFLRVTGQSGSELAGAAFQPRRHTALLQLPPRHGAAPGITYEVRGPFRTSVAPPPSTTTTTTLPRPSPPALRRRTTTHHHHEDHQQQSTTSTTAPPVANETLIAHRRDLAISRQWEQPRDRLAAGELQRHAMEDRGPPLGYGDPVTTVVSYGPNANNKYVTTYFRRTFQATHGYTRSHPPDPSRRRRSRVCQRSAGGRGSASDLRSPTTRSPRHRSAAPPRRPTPLSRSLRRWSGSDVVAVEIHQSFAYERRHRVRPRADRRRQHGTTLEAERAGVDRPQSRRRVTPAG